MGEIGEELLTEWEWNSIVVAKNADPAQAGEGRKRTQVDFPLLAAYRELGELGNDFAELAQISTLGDFNVLGYRWVLPHSS